MESMFLFMSAYALFNIGEMAKDLTNETVECSGIIVCLFGSIVMGVYAKPNIEEGQREKVGATLNSMARVADMCIFAAVGLCCFFFKPSSEARDARTAGSRGIKTAVETLWYNGGVSFGLQTILFCLVVRAIVLLVMIPPLNAFKKWRGYEPINLGTSVMIWHSQLRGGLTLLMALMIDPSWSIAEQENPVDNKPVLVDATIIVILGFCFLSGTTCPMMLRLCKVPMGVEDEDGSLPYEGLTFDILQRVHVHLTNMLVLKTSKEKDSTWSRSFLNRRNSDIVLEQK
jgi:NhaP-type Na+/H+ or K+/H+ antiporter